MQAFEFIWTELLSASIELNLIAISWNYASSFLKNIALTVLYVTAYIAVQMCQKY